MSPRATSARDAGLALISRINRWVLAASIGLAGVIALVAEHSFHGHTATAAASTSQSQSSGSSASNSTGDSIQQPTQAPSSAAPVAPAPVVVSGGS
jgi:hypothetical protein